jgi:hypothetical protein
MKLQHRIAEKLWYWWHCELRYLYDTKGSVNYVCNGRSRPVYHMCCNGNAGGWRTKLCNKLETYWRYEL